MQGESVSGVGVQGFSTTTGTFAALPTYIGIGVYGNSNVGPGVYGLTDGTKGDSYGVGAYSSGTGITSLFSEAAGDKGSTMYARTHQDGYLMVGASFEHGNIVSIDGSGNIVIAGTVTQNGSGIAVTRSSTGHNVATYANRTSAPTIEDMGEGSLLNGHAYVALDPQFASTTDHKAKYLVFITPRGASGGLYVTGASDRGFSVIENGTAHSSLLFDYRIVAQPLDSAGTRLGKIRPENASSVIVPNIPTRKI